jgi:hypothetical protein
MQALMNGAAQAIALWEAADRPSPAEQSPNAG